MVVLHDIAHMELAGNQQQFLKWDIIVNNRVGILIEGLLESLGCTEIIPVSQARATQKKETFHRVPSMPEGGHKIFLRFLHPIALVSPFPQKEKELLSGMGKKLPDFLI